MRGLLSHVIAVALAALCGAAAAQTFPAKPVRVIVPYAPGGGTDNLVRVIAPSVGANLGQQLVIENRPGGGSIIGTEIVAKAGADGYTVLATDLALVVNPGLFKSKMPFDTVKSLTGITMLASAPVLLVTHPSVAANNLKELLSLARARPGYLNYASGGYGASTHLAGELMKQAAKVFIVHIPYKGTGPAMADLLAGQVHMQFAGISSARSHVEAGRLRAIAVTGKRRNPAMPSVPTFDESALPGIDADTYWGLYAPVGVPAPVIAVLNKAFVAALRSPAHAGRLTALGFEVVGNAPQEHTQQFQSMIARWTEVIDKGKITTE
ncbi:MAG: tripartite tricarboxylate transporter substrate binding protein [Betaproteobacteria bacterium]|nr:MAG: tripartite tricarboxylate transporter substrate binding protein [Betaproteobacteria bacterium]